MSNETIVVVEIKLGGVQLNLKRGLFKSHDITRYQLYGLRLLKLYLEYLILQFSLVKTSNILVGRNIL